MNKYLLVSATAVTAIGMAVAMVSPAYAWHPEGKIVKTVQNVTMNGSPSDANTSSQAVSAAPGDTLRYSITVSNPAKPAEKQYNDLAFTVLKDNLPQGVELVDEPTRRTITENLGTILPGKSVTKHYMVKVTATSDGIIENKACFEGNSVVKDAPRKGCDTANVLVTVPPAPVIEPQPESPAPQPEVKAAETVTPQTLPATGAAGLFVLSGAAAAAGYAGNLLRLRRRG